VGRAATTVIGQTREVNVDLIVIGRRVGNQIFDLLGFKEHPGQAFVGLGRNYLRPRLFAEDFLGAIHLVFIEQFLGRRANLDYPAPL
jgi:hypothetical protein